MDQNPTIDPCFVEGELSVKFQVPGLSSLQLSEKEAESGTFQFRHWRWRASAQLCKSNLHVALYRCGVDPDAEVAPNWKQSVRLAVSVLSQTEEGNPVLWNSHFPDSGPYTYVTQYTAEQDDFIWDTLLSYQDLSARGYSHNDTLLLQIKLVGGFPHGVGCAAAANWGRLVDAEGLGPGGPAFLSLLESGEDADVTLLPKEEEDKGVECEGIPAHSFLLKARSPVFMALLRHDMAEKKTGVVRLRSLSAPSLSSFVRFLYSGEVTEELLWASMDELVEMLDAAEQYSLPGLKGLVGLAMTRLLAPDNAIWTLLVLGKFGLSEVEAFVKAFIMDERNFSDVMGSGR